MAHAGWPGGSRSPGLSRGRSRSRQDRLRPPQGKQLLYGAEDEEDWETDPDPTHNASRPWGEREISTSSLISDLSRSIRDLSLGKSSPCGPEDGGALRRRLWGYEDPTGSHRKAVERHRPPLCPHVLSSPSLGIERSSLFNRNAVEKLDTFFSEKLKAWASDTAHLSDTDAPLEEAPGYDGRWRSAEKWPAGNPRPPRRQSHRWAARVKGGAAAEGSRGGHHGLLRFPRHKALCTGGSAGLCERQEGSRLSTSGSSSARILPQCRVSHVQSCRACQAFNQDLPPGRESAWAPLQEEDGAGARAPLQKQRTHLPCQQQIPNRLSKVQQWLEQTPMEAPPAPLRQPQKHSTQHLAGPETLRHFPACDSPGRREGRCWGRALDAAGDHQHRGAAPEGRHQRQSRREEAPGHAPATPTPNCEDTSTSPATCSCLYCEQQRPRAQLLCGQERPDPSAEEVAVQLQAENRVPRIVEAFERRSLREAKLAEQELALQAALQKDSERKRRGERRQGPQASGPRTAPQEQPRQRNPKHGRRKDGEAGGKRAGLLDRLRGRH